VVTVTQVNNAPVAVDESATTSEDIRVALSVRANDTDVDGDALAVTSVTAPTNGSVVIVGDTTMTYTPNAGFGGPDTFTYMVSDGHKA